MIKCTFANPIHWSGQLIRLLKRSHAFRFDQPLKTRNDISHNAPSAIGRTAPARTGVVGKMAALLLQELDGSELSKIPKTVQSKLERIVSDQQYEIDSLKAQQEQFRVDSGELSLV